MKKRKTLLLIDTSALVYRAYHALPPLTTKDGTMVNAVYGVASTLLAVYKTYAPDYVIAAFDTDAPTFRHKAYKDYKATRTETPDDLRAQFAPVRELIAAFGILGLEQPGFEADDIIGTVARAVVAQRDDVDVIIVTGDNDALQLVGERICVHTFGRGLSDAKLYDAPAVEAKYGIPPALLADYKGFAGDASDNIPGVRGVGAKTATKLLAAHGSLEGVYAHIDEIKGALKEKLLRDKRQAFLSRDLGRIATDVSLAYDLEAARVQNDWARVRAFFQEMNFFSLLKRLPDASENTKRAMLAQEQVREEKYDTVAPDDVPDVLAALAREAAVAVMGVWRGATLIGVALAARQRRAHAILFTDRTRDALAHFFARTDRRASVTTFDLKALIHALAAEGITLAPPYNDVMLQAYVLGAGTAISLERCAQEVLGTALVPEAEQLALVPDDAAAVRAAQLRADTVLQLAHHYAAQIARVARTQSPTASIATVLTELELPLVPVLARMEDAGIACDTATLARIADELATELAALEKRIHAAAHTPFNINSPKQLAHVLFDVLALPTDGIKKTKTGYSTAAPTLEKLRGAHPVIAALEEYRELFKLKSTYVDALPQAVGADGRIHTTFQQAVTATGRLSSTDPNLQNIPTRTTYAQRIRSAFVARAGSVLLSADYSQIDLRCVAHLAEDETMIAAFARGEDIHTVTAMEVFGVSKSKVTKAMRRTAKALNFGLIYGMGAYGFAQAAGISMEEARAFIDRYFTRFAGVQRYMERTIAQARERGYVETPFGRRRAVPEITSPNQQLARSGERMAINMPVQGMAADIMKKAMIAADAALAERYDRRDVQMLLQVHDEIICEVRAPLVEEVAALLTKEMTQVAALRVPLVVDTVWGATWADLK